MWKEGRELRENKPTEICVPSAAAAAAVEIQLESQFDFSLVNFQLISAQSPPNPSEHQIETTKYSTAQHSEHCEIRSINAIGQPATPPPYSHLGGSYYAERDSSSSSGIITAEWHFIAFH